MLPYKKKINKFLSDDEKEYNKIYSKKRIVIEHTRINENKRPVVRITGSHKHSCIFGAVSIEGK